MNHCGPAFSLTPLTLSPLATTIAVQTGCFLLRLNLAEFVVDDALCRNSIELLLGSEIDDLLLELQLRGT
jgi:hypothetical protein